MSFQVFEFDCSGCRGNHRYRRRNREKFMSIESGSRFLKEQP